MRTKKPNFTDIQNFVRAMSLQPKVTFRLISIIILAILFSGTSFSVSAATPVNTQVGMDKDKNFVLYAPWGDGVTAIIGEGYLYGKGDHDIGLNQYYAIDFNLQPNNSFQAIYPAQSGDVVYAGWMNGGLGNTVILKHSYDATSDYYTLYGHLKDIYATVGPIVRTSASVLGTEGKTGGTTTNPITGEHLHFAVFKCDKSVKIPSGLFVFNGSCKSVIPEPLIGREVYEGFGLPTFNLQASLLGKNPGNDSPSGPPSSAVWGSDSTQTGTNISPGQGIVLSVDNLPSDTKEVRLTAYYPNWSKVLSSDWNNKVWRILARCWPGVAKSTCSWSNNNTKLQYKNTKLQYAWYPHDDDFQFDADWLPSGSDKINQAYNSSSKNQVCISFDVFDQAGNVSYAPAGVQCNITAAQTTNTFAVSHSLANTNDASLRVFYILPKPGPTQPPASPTPQNGIELVSVSNHTVQPGEKFNPSVTIRVVSGSLKVGDHLHATPEDQSNVMGAWPVQPINSNVSAGQTYTFDVNNNSGFQMTAPTTPGNYQSIWQMRVGGNHIGPQAIINITVLAANHAPPSPTGGTPGDGGEVRSAQGPEMCWNAVSDPEGDPVTYYAETFDNSPARDNSGWISGTCWRPANIGGHNGAYEWHIKASDNHGAESGYSSTFYFTLTAPPYDPQQPTSVPQSVTTLPVQTGYSWNSAYLYRRPLAITTNGDLKAGMVIKVDGMDLATLIAEGKMRSDGNDLRVVRRLSATTWQEVPRNYYSGWDLEFQLLSDIYPVTDTSYYLYYGNPNAGAPPTYTMPNGWYVDMYTDKWWSSWGGTWEFNQTMDFSEVCQAPLNHASKINSSYDDSDKYRSWVYIPTTGVWTFSMYNGDGYRMSIDDVEIAHFDGYGPTQWYNTSPVNLNAGWHKMEALDMWVGCSSWKLAMSGPGFAFQIIPANYFRKTWGNIKTGVNASAEEAGSPPTPTPTITTTPTNSPTFDPNASPTLTLTPTKTSTSTPTLTPTPMPGSGLACEYYNNANFTYFAFNRIDPTLDFDWGSGSPDSSINPDTFSILCKGKVRPEYSGTYTFYVYADDGVHLWVNGQLLIDSFTDGTSERSGAITLTGGQLYDIRLEYYENGGGALLKFSWSSPNQSKQIIPQSNLYPKLGAPSGNGTGLNAEYYDNQDFTNLKFTRIDPIIYNDWLSGSPDPSIGPDQWSARWTGFVQPRYSELYYFCTLTDDGGRLWIDGQLIIDYWADGTTERCGTINLIGGQFYSIRMDFYENGGGAVAKLSWETTINQPKEIIPASQLYPQLPPTATATLIATNTPIPSITQTRTNTIVPPSLTPTATTILSMGTNLALNKSVITSSGPVGYEGNRAVDGDLDTRWGSEASDPQWIQVDLGATYSIQRVVLNWEAAYGTTYRIETSNDGTAWTTIYNTTTGDGSVDDLTLATPVSGRYVRVYGTQRIAVDWGYSLWEFQIYGIDNLSSTPTITPSATFTPMPTSTHIPMAVCNTGAISINDNSSALPYPSTITLAGSAPSITHVSVQLLGLTHTWPDDIDVLLVGPQGQNITIMSDAGGGTDVSNLDLTFDDSAAQPLPDDSMLTSGTYRPMNYESGDIFPTPAPSPSSATTLATFNGTNPNGIWSLYAVDDADFDDGSLASGWCLSVMSTTIPSTSTPTATRPPATKTPIPTVKTFISTAAQDGWILESNETSSIGGTLNSTATIFNIGDDAGKKQYRSILSFSTGAGLPDNAVITSVMLKIKQQGTIGGSNPLTIFKGLMADIKNGFFSTSPALQISDFQAVASGVYGISSPTLVSNVYTLNLTNGKLYINKLAANSGLTQIRLRFKLDDNNNAVANYLSLFSGNAPTAANRPQLVVTYYIP